MSDFSLVEIALYQFMKMDVAPLVEYLELCEQVLPLLENQKADASGCVYIPKNTITKVITILAIVRCKRVYKVILPFYGANTLLIGVVTVHNTLSGFPAQNPIAKAQTIDRNKLTTACFHTGYLPQLTFYRKMLQ